VNNTIKLPEGQVVSDYINNHSLIELQKKFNIKSYGPIKRILKQYNIPLRKPGQTLRKNHLKVDENFFAEINSPVKAYWLGFFIADGHIQKDETKASLISKDLEVIKKFKSAINSDHAINNNINYDKRTNKTYKSFSIQVSSRRFVSNLIKQGVTNSKSVWCPFPHLQDEFYPHFIRGMFDGDGSICFVNGKIRISLIAANGIIHPLQDYLIEKLKFSKTALSQNCHNPKAKQKKLHVSRAKDIERFLEFIYQNASEEILLSRKFNIYLSINSVK
jgi:hypothetical protein